MKSETVSMLRNNMLFHLKPQRQRLAELKLHEDDFVAAFDAVTKSMDNKIDNKIWAFVLQGLANATRGKDGSQKTNVRTNLG